MGKAEQKLDRERMDRLWETANERGYVSNRVVGGGGGSGGGGMALPEMSCDVLFAERTEDNDNAMAIDREEMAETAEVMALAEAEKDASVAEEEEYSLRGVDFSYPHMAARVTENDEIWGGLVVIRESQWQ